jgi:hypothetical protein
MAWKNLQTWLKGVIIAVIVWAIVELMALLLNDPQNYGFMILNLPSSIYYSSYPQSFNNFYVALVSLLIYIIVGIIIGLIKNSGKVRKS